MNNKKHLHRFLATTMALVLVVGIATPAFGQIADPNGTPTPGAGAVATTTSNSRQICHVLDFEGVGNLFPVGSIGTVAFSPNALGIVDSDAGGSGNFANEPSPSTIMFSLVGNTITANLAYPVNEISWNYVAPGAAQIQVFGAGNALLATIPLPAIAQTNPGDPNGAGFGTWAAGTNTQVGNVITSVQYTGLADFAAWDNLDFCETVVGGMPMSVDTTALLLAGAQTNAVWIISALAVIGSVAFGALYINTKRN